MTWWIWIVAGIAMIVSEFAVPAFVICFFGAGAVLTGLLLLLCPGIGLAWQLLIFSIASIAFTLTGRKLFAGSRNGRMEDPDQDAVSGFPEGNGNCRQKYTGKQILPQIPAGICKPFQIGCEQIIDHQTADIPVKMVIPGNQRLNTQKVAENDPGWHFQALVFPDHPGNNETDIGRTQPFYSSF